MSNPLGWPHFCFQLPPSHTLLSLGLGEQCPPTQLSSCPTVCKHKPTPIRSIPRFPFRQLRDKPQPSLHERHFEMRPWAAPRGLWEASTLSVHPVHQPALFLLLTLQACSSPHPPLLSRRLPPALPSSEKESLPLCSPIPVGWPCWVPITPHGLAAVASSASRRRGPDARTTEGLVCLPLQHPSPASVPCV